MDLPTVTIGQASSSSFTSLSMQKQAPEDHLEQLLSRIADILACVDEAHIEILQKFTKGLEAEQDYRFSATFRKTMIGEKLKELEFDLKEHGKLPNGRAFQGQYRSTTSPRMKLGLLYSACVAEGLGNYDATEFLYSLACSIPSGYDQEATLQVCLDYVAGCPDRSSITLMVHYLQFLVRTCRRPELAIHMLKALPWISGACLQLTEVVRFSVLYSTIEWLNNAGRFEEAASHISTAKHVYSVQLYDENPGSFLAQEAILEAGLGNVDDSRRFFIEATVLNSIINGLWHESTLESLFHFGNALREWGEQESAIVLLAESCRGTYYRFGASHPKSIRNFQALRRCRGTKPSLQAMWEMKHFKGGTRQLSIAYEHIELFTVIDLLRHVPGVDLNFVETLLRKRPLTNCRNVMLEQTDLACRALKHGRVEHKSWTRFSSQKTFCDAESVGLNLARISWHAISSSKDLALTEVKALLLSIQKSHRTNRPEIISAVHRRLTYLGLNHFPRELLVATPSLISEAGSEVLGTGVFAIVESINIGSDVYARKNIALPRSRQAGVQNSIQNEISIIRRLEHPHIINVHLTYEDMTRFYIVMEPRADCDLEAFLSEHTRADLPGFLQLESVQMWFICLSNALSFIHYKGIRHKDIKPKNILLRDKDILFADFGSSYAFYCDSGSTTEGPSFGHTKTYCAPEVIKQNKRNRSADIFSLGCVFTELAVWLWADSHTERKYYHISEWHTCREISVDGYITNAYHASLPKIQQWFDERSSFDLMLCHFYTEVLMYLLKIDPSGRWNARETSKNVSGWLEDVIGGLECDQCCLDPLIDDEATAPSGHITSV